MTVYLVYLDTFGDNDTLQAIFLKEKSADNFVRQCGGLNTLYVSKWEIDEDEE